jgi:hypothetical protein
MKTERFPITVTQYGVSALIRKYSQKKNGREYTSYLVDYSLLGQRKQKWESDLQDAKNFAADVCQRIAFGEQAVLELRNADRLTYLRASEEAAKVKAPLDIACRDYAQAIAILGGIATTQPAAHGTGGQLNVLLRQK